MEPTFGVDYYEDSRRQEQPRDPPVRLMKSRRSIDPTLVAMVSSRHTAAISWKSDTLQMLITNSWLLQCAGE